QLSVRGPGPDVEVDVAGPVAGGVSVTALDQPLDQLDHLRDVAGRTRLVRGLEDVDGRVGGVELALEVVRVLPPRPAGLGRLREDLVVDVGHVADVRDLIAAAHQPPPQHVESDLRAHVPNV